MLSWPGCGVGSWLTSAQGESPYEDATDVLRKKMGAKRKPNHFTLHGQLHEPIALKEYKKGWFLVC